MEIHASPSILVTTCMALMCLQEISQTSTLYCLSSQLKRKDNTWIDKLKEVKWKELLFKAFFFVLILPVTADQRHGGEDLIVTAEPDDHQFAAPNMSAGLNQLRLDDDNEFPPMMQHTEWKIWWYHGIMWINCSIWSPLRTLHDLTGICSDGQGIWIIMACEHL